MVDVVIIGGGIAGCSTAWYLAEDGLDVLLLERGALNSQASGANAGSLHAQIQHEPFVEFGESWVTQYLPALPFYRHSIDLWEIAAEQFGQVIEFSRDGGLIVASTTDQMRQIEAKAELEERAGLGTELLDASALQKIAPYVTSKMIGGALCPIEGKANPLCAAPTFASAAKSRGAEIRCNCAVTGIAKQNRAYKVSTSQGDFVAPYVVNAAGIDAAVIAKHIGLSLNLRAYAIQLTVTEPVVPFIPHLVYSAADMLTLKQTHVGTILIGGGWAARIDGQGRPQISIESLTRNLSLASQVVPSLANLLVVRSWAAVVNGTDSWLPIVGEVSSAPGFYINYVPWMGFTGGPAGGRIVADQIQGKIAEIDYDVRPFTPQY